MEIKWIGAVLVIMGCGGFGTAMAAAHRREERCLRQLLDAIAFMECSLQYRLLPLPQLCRETSAQLSGPVGRLFDILAEELEAQIAPDASSCMSAAVARTEDLPVSGRAACAELGRTLGRFDLPGQLKGFAAASELCRRGLQNLENGKSERLRSYQTLALCAGAALTILFL